MPDARPQKYVCVSCGQPAMALSKEYGTGVLKICHCELCQEPVDPYIETEVTIILIDAVLQKPEAYRHILFNIEVKAVWKLAIVFLLCDAYRLWVTQRASSHSLHLAEDIEDMVYLELEWNFYAMCLRALIETITYFIVVAMVFAVFKKMNIARKCSWNMLLHGLILSSYGKTFLLPAILWGQEVGGVTDVLILCFVLISQMQGMRVLHQTSQWTAMTAILCSCVICQVTLYFLREYTSFYKFFLDVT